MVAELPEVVEAVRFFQGWRLTVRQGETRNIVRKYFFTEGDFFDVFDFELLQGDPSTALNKPGSVVLTKSFATQLFGDENAIGKTFNVDAEDFPQFGQTDFTVSGVLDDMPHNSHLDFKLLISLSSLDKFDDISRAIGSWNSGFLLTYVLLEEDGQLPGLNEKLMAMSAKYRGDDAWNQRKLYLQPLRPS